MASYPQKYVVIQGGIVIGTCVLYSPGGTCSGPAGSTTVEVDMSNPVAEGWYALFDDASQAWQFSPDPIMQTNATGAGGGQQRPPV